VSSVKSVAGFFWQWIIFKENKMVRPTIMRAMQRHWLRPVMFLAIIAFATSGFYWWGAAAQDKTTKVAPPDGGKVSAWPSLAQQLGQDYYGMKVAPGTALEKLIRENQDFSLLRADEQKDKRGLPPWLRVWWRKGHPEVKVIL
jgi:hypothetical protein